MMVGLSARQDHLIKLLYIQQDSGALQQPQFPNFKSPYSFLLLRYSSRTIAIASDDSDATLAHKTRVGFHNVESTTSHTREENRRATRSANCWCPKPLLF